MSVFRKHRLRKLSDHLYKSKHLTNEIKLSFSTPWKLHTGIYINHKYLSHQCIQWCENETNITNYVNYVSYTTFFDNQFAYHDKT